MTPEIAKAALVFLGRVDLKGSEAPTFLQVCTALDAMANPRPAPEKPAKQKQAPRAA